ncbi:MAG: ATP-binding protein [Gammaproteobacteria bacterium]|nr:ATP-binding protein [Gammaproteobacteria bacterium]
MTKVHVTATRDHLASLIAAKPLAALAELVWNGFDAGTDQVRVFLEFNAMSGIQTIRVRDYGDGIDCSKVETLFGSLGDSWKKNSDRQNGRALHGKNGKGRFKAFALGERSNARRFRNVRSRRGEQRPGWNRGCRRQFATRLPFIARRLGAP